VATRKTRTAQKPRFKPFRKLMGYLLERNVTQKEAADIIGISLNTFNRKLLGYRTLDFNEIGRLIEGLNIPEDRAHDIFLSECYENSNKTA